MRGALVAAALVALLVAATATTASAAANVHVSATLTPHAILFGDPVEGEVDVVVDARAVDPAQVGVATPFGAWAQIGTTSRRTTSAGALVRRSFRFTIVCRTASCVPAGLAQQVTLPTATVTVRRRDGRSVRIPVSWPQLVVASRLPAGATTAARPPFELQVTPPAARTRISPTVAAWLLVAGAAFLVAIAAGCAAFELRRRRARVAASMTPLARALALAREAESRPPDDRRRALALLARVLPDHDDVSTAAATAAWSAADPSPVEIAELVGRVEEREQSS